MKTKITLAIVIANIPVLLAFVFGNWFFLGLIPSTMICVWIIFRSTKKLMWTDYGTEEPSINNVTTKVLNGERK